MSEKKLLVADDSLTIQKVIRLALANEGYKIQAVSDGNEASQQIALFRPDIVLIDVSLPGKSAAEVKREIGDGPRFVLMSSAFEQVDETEIEALRFHGRLIKPFDPAHLRTVLNNVMASASGHAPSAPTPGGPSIGTLQRPNIPPPPTMAPPNLPPTNLPPPIKAPPSIPPPHKGQGGGDLPVFSEDLWDKNAATQTETAGAEDIRSLTEQTIKLSGLDNFQWNISEPAKKATPTPVPPGTRPSLAGEKTLTNLQIGEPSLKPPSNLSDLSGATLGWGENQPTHQTSSHDPRSLYDNAPEDTGEFTSPNLDAIESVPPPIPQNGPHSSGSMSSPPPFSGPFSGPVPGTLRDSDPSDVTQEIHAQPTPAIPLSTDQMETLISNQLGKTIEEMTQRLLPEIAERILREEIHRLLSNPPR